jgi:hypothetical protein
MVVHPSREDSFWLWEKHNFTSSLLKGPFRHILSPNPNPTILICQTIGHLSDVLAASTANCSVRKKHPFFADRITIWLETSWQNQTLFFW